jgi:hypothetical protein
MAVTAECGCRCEPGACPTRPDQQARLLRIADLEVMIERQKAASSELSAQGLPTQEIDRIIDILVSSLQLIHGHYRAIENSALDEATRAPLSVVR